MRRWACRRCGASKWTTVTGAPARSGPSRTRSRLFQVPLDRLRDGLIAHSKAPADRGVAEPKLPQDNGSCHDTLVEGWRFNLADPRLELQRRGGSNSLRSGPPGLLHGELQGRPETAFLGQWRAIAVGLRLPDPAMAGPELAARARAMAVVWRSAHLELRRTPPVGRGVEFRPRAAPGLWAGRSPWAPWRRRDGLSGAGAGASPWCHDLSPGLGRPWRACRPSRRAGRPSATR